MDELNILKEEMAAMKRNLDKEQIVNERLLRTVMKQRASWMNVFVKAEFIVLPLSCLVIAAACVSMHVSLWYVAVLFILGIIDALVDLRTFRVSPKIFSTCTMMEVKKILTRQKKERFVHLCISLPLAIVWLALFSWAVLGKGEGGAYFAFAGGIVGGGIGFAIVIWLYRKAQHTNDVIISESEE